MRNWKTPPSKLRFDTVSAPASVGASKLRLEVATGNPHPYKYGRYGVVQTLPPLFTGEVPRYEAEGSIMN